MHDFSSFANFRFKCFHMIAKKLAKLLSLVSTNLLPFQNEWMAVFLSFE